MYWQGPKHSHEDSTSTSTASGSRQHENIVPFAIAASEAFKTGDFIKIPFSFRSNLRNETMSYRRALVVALFIVKTVYLLPY